ncbi:MAG: hypothetical protein ACI8W8_002421 [Rhodothermales bacterium]|jgi:hypothetical protein
MKASKARNIWRRVCGRDSERGVALVMSLGVLSMVSLMAVAFATTALYSQNMATLSKQIVQARLQSEAAVQGLFGTLTIALADPVNPRNRYPPTRRGVANHFGPNTASSAWDGRTYWASLGDDKANLRSSLALNFGGVDITPASEEAMLDEDVGWEPVMDEFGNEVIARFCYVVIEECGKVDPNLVIERGVQEGEETPNRIGNSITDYNLAAAAPTIASKFQFVGDGDGELPINLHWLSYFHIFKAHSTAADSAADILDDVIFPYSYDIEAFNNTEEDRHRFNLVSADWNGFNNRVATSKLTQPSSRFYDGGRIAENTGGIDWLTNCQDEKIRDQIAANLIDFCDSDSEPTTDNPSNPTYLGIERLPFFNEFIFQILVYDDTATPVNDYFLALSAWPELVNMWDSEVGAGGQVSVDITMNSPDLLINPYNITLNWELGSDMSAGSYLTLPAETTIIRLGPAVTTLRDVNLTVNEARLTYSYPDPDDPSKVIEVLWDYARTTRSYTAEVQALVPRWMNAEVDDPRQNHETIDWDWSEGVVRGTDGTTNSVTDPNPAGPHDQEDGAVDAWDVSSAYIPDKPITTLWELGAVHRAHAWQTINLKSFNEDTDPAVGLDTYSLGDANMLAQVKMNGKTYCHGNINSNSHHSNVLSGLLVGLSIGDTYDAPTGSGSVIDASQAQAIIGTTTSSARGQWLFENGTANVVFPMASRGGIGRIKTLSNGSVLPQTTDMAREEVIGKIAGITTVRPNFFTVVLSTQTIHDLPTGVKGGTLGVYDENVDKVLAIQKVYYHMYRDALTNKYRIIHFEYVDI